MVGLSSLCLLRTDRMLLIKRKIPCEGVQAKNEMLLGADSELPDLHCSPFIYSLSIFMGSSALPRAKERGWIAYIFVRKVKGTHPSSLSLFHPTGLAVVHDRLQVELISVEFMISAAAFSGLSQRWWFHVSEPTPENAVLHLVFVTQPVASILCPEPSIILNSCLMGRECPITRLCPDGQGFIAF